MQFQRLGLLRACHVPQEILAPIPQVHAGVEVYDKEQRWFGACMSSFGVLYNKRVLALLKLPEPRTWADLGRPSYFTWVASSDPRLSGSMHMLYEIVLQAYGWEEGWANLVRMGANCRSFGRSAGDVPNEVAVGEAACGMAIDYYGLRAVAEAGEENLAFYLPENLTVVNPDGIGVLKGAPQAELAELFVQFVLSERGQKLWMLKVGAPGGPTEFALYRLPVIAGLVEKYRHDSLVSIDAFELKGGVEFDLAKKDARWGALNDLLGACIIDVHQDLAAAWKSLKDLPPDSERVRRLLRPPVREQDLLYMAKAMREDPAVRADTIARWSAEARDKYRRLTKE
jgi:ABC-type Fe3+ transport system substrate-binding protein